MIDAKNIKLNLWYSIKEERKPIIKNQIRKILNQLISDDYTDEKMKEIVMNCRQTLSSYLAR